MPKITYDKSGGGKIVWSAEDWLAGLHPQFSTTSTSVVRFLTNKMALQTAINPYRYVGALMPGALPTDVGNVSQVTTFLRNGVVKASSAYLVSNGALVQKITTLSAPLSIETTNWPHSINSNANSEAGQDIVLYNAKTGGTSQLQMFVSYNNSAKWDVASYTFATASTVWDDDFMSTAPATPLASPYLADGLGKPHPMVVGDDDILYMGDRNFLHGYDGQNSADNEGKFIAAVLTLPAGYVITSFSRIENFLVIYAYLDTGSGSPTYLSISKAFFWNYLDLDPTYTIDLTDNYVSGGFQYKSTIGCFTQGRSSPQSGNSSSTKVSKLKIWNGSIFETKFAFNENVPIHGGVEVLDETINWNADGVLYGWGEPYPEDFGNSSNRLTQGSGTTSGVLKTLASGIQVMSSGATTSGGLQEVDILFTEFYSNAVAILATAEPLFPKGFRGQIKCVRIQFAYTVTPGGTGGRNLVFRLVRSGTTSGSEITTLIADSDNFRSTSIDTLVKEFTTDSSTNQFPPFVALRPDLTWSAGSGGGDALPVERIEVEYDLINYQNV